MTPVPMQDNSIFSHKVYGKIFLRAKCFYSYFITKMHIFCNCKYFDFKCRRGGQNLACLSFYRINSIFSLSSLFKYGIHEDRFCFRILVKSLMCFQLSGCSSSVIFSTAHDTFRAQNSSCDS